MNRYAEMAKEAHGKKHGEDLTNVFVSWETENQKLIGKLLKIETVTPDEKMGSVQRYVFDTGDFSASCILGGATDKQLEGKLVPGDLVEITYHGKQKLKDGKREVNRFDVRRFGHEEDFPTE